MEKVTDRVLIHAWHGRLTAGDICRALDITEGRLYARWRALRNTGAIPDTGRNADHFIPKQRNDNERSQHIQAKRQEWIADLKQFAADTDGPAREPREPEQPGPGDGYDGRLHTGSSDQLLERLIAEHGAPRYDIARELANGKVSRTG